MVEWRRLALGALLSLLSLVLLVSSHYVTLVTSVHRGRYLWHVDQLAQSLYTHIAHVDGVAVKRMLDGPGDGGYDNASARGGGAHSRHETRLVTALEKQLHTPSPYFALTNMLEDVSAEARYIVNAVFRHFTAINDDGSVQHHPLTQAYRKQRYTLATRLLTHHPPNDRATREQVVREVYAAALTCGDMAHVPADVSLVTIDTVLVDTRPCVRKHPKRVSYKMSKLRMLYMQHQALADNDDAATDTTRSQEELLASMLRQRLREPLEAPAPPRIVAPPSTVRSRMWTQPIGNLSTPPNMLPPYTALLMHPSLFHDMADALWYYATGVAYEHVRWRQHASVLLGVPLWGVVLLALLAQRAMTQRRASTTADSAPPSPPPEPAPPAAEGGAGETAAAEAAAAAVEAIVAAVPAREEAGDAVANAATPPVADG